MKPQFVFIDYVWPIGMPIRRQFSGGHITDRIASNFKGASREGVGAGEGKQKPVSRQLSDINCQCGQLSVRTTVSADNCQCRQLSVGTTVRGPTVSGNCQCFPGTETTVRSYSFRACNFFQSAGDGERLS